MAKEKTTPITIEMIDAIRDTMVVSIPLHNKALANGLTYECIGHLDSDIPSLDFRVWSKLGGTFKALFATTLFLTHYYSAEARHKAIVKALEDAEAAIDKNGKGAQRAALVAKRAEIDAELEKLDKELAE